MIYFAMLQCRSVQFNVGPMLLRLTGCNACRGLHCLMTNYVLVISFGFSLFCFFGATVIKLHLKLCDKKDLVNDRYHSTLPTMQL